MGSTSDQDTAADGRQQQLFLQNLATSLGAMPHINHYIVAFSGGLDSMVLLHGLWTIANMHNGALTFKAVHVNHGLQAEAADWVKHCEAVCYRFEIPFESINVEAQPAPGESPEAAARQARYAALRKQLQPGDCLLTAHHQDDQAETLLLQLLRGSGPMGLAAMPVVAVCGLGWHLRPILDISRETLTAYAQQHNLKWIEDLSNADTRYDRNYLRNTLSPLIAKRWPGWTKTLSRAARHQAQAAKLIIDQARSDMSEVLADEAEALSLEKLHKLPAERQHHVLRYWLQQKELPTPSDTVLKNILLMQSAAKDSTPLVAWSDVEVRRYQGKLYAFKQQQPVRTQQYLWQLPEALQIDELGIALSPQRLFKLGVRLADGESQLIVRFRQGGERIRLPGREHSHCVKKLLQARKVPPWLRDRLPFVYEGDRLLGIFGIEPPILADNVHSDEDS